MMRARAALLILPLLGPAPVLAAGVYKWVDAQGVTHYDDHSVTQGQRLDRAYLDRRKVREVPKWLGMVPAEFAAQVKQRCELARSRRDNYRAAGQLYGRDPGGNVYAYSPTQSQLLLAESERETARYCAADAPQRLYAQRRSPTGGSKPLGY